MLPIEIQVGPANLPHVENSNLGKLQRAQTRSPLILVAVGNIPTVVFFSGFGIIVISRVMSTIIQAIRAKGRGAMFSQ